MKKSIILLLSVTLLAGCATRGANYTPLVDLKGRNVEVFNTNLEECRQYAKKRMNAQSGAFIGALAGALLSVVAGGSNRGRNTAAVIGATKGAKVTNDTQESIIRMCLAGRGYKVLN